MLRRMFSEGGNRKLTLENGQNLRIIRIFFWKQPEIVAIIRLDRLSSSRI